jgi:transglutaminase-like putative cysteine protease
VVVAAARRRRRLVVAVVALALVPLGLLAAGATVHDLLPGGWAGFATNFGDAISAVPSVRVPYTGLDPYVRMVTLAGGIALVAVAFLAAAALPRRGRAVAVAALVVVYALPATETSAGSPYLGGAVFTLLVGAVLWGERVARPGTAGEAPTAVLLLVLAAVAGIAVGPAVDAQRPWVNWDKLINDLTRSDTEQFSWNHTYGPLDWPRDGRTVMRIKAPQSSYWKAADLDGFDGRRWVQAGLRPDRATGAAGVADVRPHPQWEENIRVTLTGIRTNQVIGAGSTLALNRLRLSPLPVGSPGTYAVAGQLQQGDTYNARVYVPHPTTDQLIQAGTQYPDVMELYRSFRLPNAANDPARDTEMVFAPFGTHRQPIALGPTASIAASGAKVLQSSAYGRTWALARRLLAGAQTPFEYARRIDSYLNSGRYAYAENVPRSAVPLDAFLFRDLRGYCQQFSGAMALLLRMGGVPARVAAGFSPGELDPSRGEYVIRDSDAHSWVEAYFPHYGWVTFDPTPAIAPARAQAPFDPSGSATGGPEGDTSTGRVADPKAGTTTVSGPGHASFPFLPLLAAVAALALVVVLALLARRRLHRRRPSGRDPRLAELERALRRSGRPPGSDTTLRGLERTFAGEPEAAAYVRGVREARYGYGAPAPSREQRRALRRALAAGWGGTGRARGLWALPPSVGPRA